MVPLGVATRLLDKERDMLEIYRAYRDADYMALQGQPRVSILEAIVETIRMFRWLRTQCRNDFHVKIDVWGDRCWHERLEDKIERLEARATRNPWNDPEVVWTPYQPYELDEVDFAAPAEPVARRGAVESAHWWRPV